MEIKRLIVGPLGTNCYILSEGNDSLVIDPGGDDHIILEYLEKKRLIPKAIIATHGHFDHVLSVHSLKSVINVPFYLHKREEKILAGYSEFVKNYIGINPGPTPVPDQYLSKGTEFKLGDSTLIVIETPGHTPGSCSFIVGNSMFVGDFVFNGSIGRTDFGGSYSEMSTSIRMLKKMENNLDIYPGHGDFTSLDNEKTNNPFFKEIF